MLKSLVLPSYTAVALVKHADQLHGNNLCLCVQTIHTTIMQSSPIEASLQLTVCLSIKVAQGMLCLLRRSCA